MRLCILAGMIDAKLKSKIEPLQALEEVDEIYLIRRKSYSGPKIRCISPPPIFLSFLPLAELWRFGAAVFICLFRRPDVLIAMGTVPHGIYAWWLSKIFRLPVVQHVMGKNDLRLTFERQKGKQITLAAVKAADMVAVRGRNMARWLEAHGIAKERIFIPQNVHDFTLFAPIKAGIPKYEFIYVGLLARYKRVDRLLKALAISAAHGKNYRLLIVGDGPERKELEAMSSQMGISDTVHFAGTQPYGILPGFLNQAKTFVMTSQGEGLPMAVIEALSCGLPVIAMDDADIREVVKDGTNGILVPPGDIDGFAEAMSAISDDEELYSKLRQGALALREEKREEFSLGFQTKLWRRKLHHCIRRQRP